jgi:hypothetical protein
MRHNSIHPENGVRANALLTFLAQKTFLGLTQIEPTLLGCSISSWIDEAGDGTLGRACVQTCALFTGPCDQTPRSESIVASMSGRETRRYAPNLKPPALPGDNYSLINLRLVYSSSNRDKPSGQSVRISPCKARGMEALSVRGASPALGR